MKERNRKKFMIRKKVKKWSTKMRKIKTKIKIKKKQMIICYQNMIMKTRNSTLQKKE